MDLFGATTKESTNYHLVLAKPTKKIRIRLSGLTVRNSFSRGLVGSNDVVVKFETNKGGGDLGAP